MRRVLLIAIFGFFLSLNPSYSASPASTFKLNNPDVGKYEFSRSYISALGYLNVINERWKKSSPKNVYAGDDIKIMRGYVAYLIKDNADLRIAKNYLIKYLASRNILIRKTADTFIAACQTEIAINDQERAIWDQWFAVKSNNLDSRVNEKAFLKTQEQLSLDRKVARRGVIEASVLLTKVLRSELNANEKGKILAVNTKDRAKLLDYLEGYGSEMIAWGLKPGQDYVQASVAIIREVLEDSIYKSIDE